MSDILRGYRYTIERWPHGWLIVGAQDGIPLEAFSEIAPLFPKNAVMDIGIANYYSGPAQSRVVLCAVTEPERIKWRAEIEKELAKMNPEWAWWRGLDVGQSAMSIFAVLATDKNLSGDASRKSNEAVPHDAGDFGRCLRLVEKFGWRSRLNEVAECYPASAWPQIIARWDELASADVRAGCQILSDINAAKQKSNAQDRSK